MCFSRHRIFRRDSKPVDNDNPGSKLMRLFVETTSLNNGHAQGPLATATKNSPSSTIADSNNPIASLDSTAISQLKHIYRSLGMHRPPTFRNMSFPTTRTTRSLLSQKRLVDFLEVTQGEKAIAPLDKERYTFEEFLEAWLNHYSSDAVRTLEPDNIVDLSLPISDYFISSSHNTYLVGNQLSSEASAGEYKKVIENKCRCIEIDVWDAPAKAASKQRASSHARSSKDHGHRSLLSANSAATSIPVGLELVTHVLTSMSRSRASSVSQSLSKPVDADNHGGGAELQGVTLADSVAALSRFRGEDSTLVGEEARDNDGASTSAGEELARPLVLQDTDSSTAAPISVVPLDSEATTPAMIPDKGVEVDSCEPVVMHAHKIKYVDNALTLGTHVPFRDVCRVIRHTAFNKNTMPVIVSLEVHADAEQQQKMVDIMKDEWRGFLLDEPIDGTDPLHRLPTLGELQNKILVKVKKPRELWPASAGSNITSTQQANGLGVSLPVMPPCESASGASVSEDDAANSNANTVEKSPSITKELGKLAVYTESRHFEDFAHPNATYPPHIFSLDEIKIAGLHITNHKELFHHNTKYLMRAYPNATRHFRSTNPEPACLWRRGVQMVALNWQTMDEAMMLNHAMFDGSDGWVLKPPGYRGTSSPSAANRSLAASLEAIQEQCLVGSAEPTSTLDLCITVYSGSRLPLPVKKKNGDHVIAGHKKAQFRPVVKVELNIERPGERCPELKTILPRSGVVEHAAAAACSTITPVASPAVTISFPTKLSETSLKRKTPAGQSDHPSWGSRGEILRFRNIAGIVEALSFVTFIVEDRCSRNPLRGTNTLAGWACIRLDRLQTGYRFVQLLDACGHHTKGTLLVRIDKTVR